MGIWKQEFSLADLNNRSIKTLGSLIGIEFTEIGDNYIVAIMPVDERTMQPAGLLHGGANVVLAETLGSIASNFCIDNKKYMAVGLEINANHMRPVTSGMVIGIVTPIHIGRTTHVWEIKIFKDVDKLSCISRLTVSIIPRINPRLAPKLSTKAEKKIGPNTAPKKEKSIPKKSKTKNSPKKKSKKNK